MAFASARPSNQQAGARGAWVTAAVTGDAVARSRCPTLPNPHARGREPSTRGTWAHCSFNSLL